jgi:hypothetical protein
MDHMREKKLLRILFYFGYLQEPVAKIRRIKKIQNSGVIRAGFFFHKSPFIFLSSKKCKKTETLNPTHAHSFFFFKFVK